MSLLSPNKRIVVGFAPERLSALYLGGLLRPRLLDRHAVPLTGNDPAHWAEPLRALSALLDEPVWHGQEIGVILSSHYVRYIVVPAGRNLTQAECLALAKVLFHETYGDLADNWEIRVSPPGMGLATIASGVPRDLLADLDKVCGKRGRLTSVRPSLMPVFNRARRLMGKAAGYLAVVEAGRIVLVSVANRQWKSADSRAGDGTTLPHLLQEEGELHGRQPGGILWLSDLTASAKLPTGVAWSHRRIDPPRLAGMDDIPNLASWGLP